MSKPPDPASNAPGSRSRASSRQPSKEDLRDALKEADDERKELRIRLEIQEKQIAQLMQLLPKPTPQVEPEKPSTDEPKGAPSSSNVGPYAETPPIIKPVVVEKLATPASPGDPPPQPLPPQPQQPPLGNNPAQAGGSAQDGAQSSTDIAALLLQLEAARLENEKHRRDAEERAEQRYKEQQEFMVELLQRHEMVVSEVSTAVTDNAKQLKLNRENLESRRDKQTVDLNVPKPPDLEKGLRNSCLALVEWRNELCEVTAVVLPQEIGASTVGKEYVMAGWNYSVEQFKLFLKDQSHRFDNAKELEFRKMAIKDKHNASDVDAKIVQEITSLYDGDITKWTKDATKLEVNPYRTGTRTLSYLFYRALTRLYDGRSSTAKWQSSIQGYPLHEEMSPFALLNDLQNLDWLLHFALLIKCNVDAREIADKLSDAVSQRAGEIWFQEPMYNFAFFPTTAQELKYPLLDAYDLEKLRTRIDKIEKEIQSHPWVSAPTTKKVEKEKVRRAPEKPLEKPSEKPPEKPADEPHGTPKPPEPPASSRRTRTRTRTPTPSAATPEEPNKAEAENASESGRAVKIGEKVCLFYKHSRCLKPDCTFLHASADFHGEGYCRKCNDKLENHVDGNCPTFEPRRFPKKNEEGSDAESSKSDATKTSDKSKGATKGGRKGRGKGAGQGARVAAGFVRLMTIALASLPEAQSRLVADIAQMWNPQPVAKAVNELNSAPVVNSIPLPEVPSVSSIESSEAKGVPFDIFDLAKDDADPRDLQIQKLQKQFETLEKRLAAFDFEDSQVELVANVPLNVIKPKFAKMPYVSPYATNVSSISEVEKARKAPEFFSSGLWAKDWAETWKQASIGVSWTNPRTFMLSAERDAFDDKEKVAQATTPSSCVTGDHSVGAVSVTSSQAVLDAAVDQPVENSAEKSAENPAEKSVGKSAEKSAENSAPNSAAPSPLPPKRDLTTAKIEHFMKLKESAKTAEECAAIDLACAESLKRTKKKTIQRNKAVPTEGVAEMMDGYGFLDTGSLSVLRKPHRYDKPLRNISIEGVGGHEKPCTRLRNGEVAVEGEPLIILPWDPIAAELKPEWDDDEGVFVFSSRNPKEPKIIKTLHLFGHHWFLPADTEYIRMKLAKAYRSGGAYHHFCRKVDDGEQVDAGQIDLDVFVKDKVEITSELAYEQAPDLYFLGQKSLLFREACEQEPLLTTAMKPLTFNLTQRQIAATWANSSSMTHFLSRLKQFSDSRSKTRASHLADLDIDTFGEKKKPLLCSEFAHRATINPDIPISHMKCHFPKLPGCPHCFRGRREIHPIIRSENDPSIMQRSDEIEVYSDFVGKRLPLSGKGERWMFIIGSSLGHRMILASRDKTAEDVLKMGKIFLKHTGLKRVRWHMDHESIEKLKEHVEKNDGEFNTGISGRSNSHSLAENLVKWAIGQLRTTVDMAGTPPKDWAHCGNVISVNFCRERGIQLGIYEGDTFVFGECSDIKLQPTTYSPPITSTPATRVQFKDYDLDSRHSILVEFFDQNVGKRRTTQVSSSEFAAGLPKENRPLFGYATIRDQAEPLKILLDPLLPGEEEIAPAPLPQVKETPAPSGRPAKQKKERGRAALKGEENADSDAETDTETEPDHDMKGYLFDIYGDNLGDEQRVPAVEISEQEYDILVKGGTDSPDLESAELVADIGRLCCDDLIPERDPREVSQGESMHFANVPRLDRPFVKLVKSVKNAELREGGEYAHLDWRSQEIRESDKLFSKFKALRDEPRELRNLPIGAHVVRCFTLPTIKNYEVKSEWQPSIRCTAGGDKIQEKLQYGWRRAQSVKSQRDVIESATAESTDAFICCAKLRGDELGQEDADGAYLQARREKEGRKPRRPNGLWAIVPKSLWPSDSKAHELNRPCFPVDGSLYGLEEAGFEWDEHLDERLEAENWHPLHDIDLSIREKFPEGVDPPPMTEGEPVDYSELTDYESSLLKYVDDALIASPGGNESIGSAVKVKPGGPVTKFVGQEFAQSDDGKLTAKGQIAYVEAALKDFEQDLEQHQQKPLRTYNTPALKNEQGYCVELDQTPGIFAGIAASRVQSLAYIARLCRKDILMAVNRASRYVAQGRWMRRHDLWLTRIYGYLHATRRFISHAIIDPEDLKNCSLCFENYFDADHAGCAESKRSTTGWYAVLTGKNTFCPLAGLSKRQGEVSLSTPEAEVTAGVAVAKRAIRIHMLLCRLLRANIEMMFYGANSAADKIIGSGVSPQLAYLKRTQGLSLAWSAKHIGPYLHRVPTSFNTSDIFTKPLEVGDFEKHRMKLGIWEAPITSQ